MSNANERESRLLATMLNVLVAGMSDPTRLSRGRSYARQGAVIDLRVEPGVIAGEVQGSRAAPYRVNVFTKPAQNDDTFAALVPRAAEVAFECSCPDWDDPCKHAIAVMVRFAELTAGDSSNLLRWRGHGLDETPRAVVGSRRGAASTAAHDTGDRAAELDALRVHLGETTEFDLAHLDRLELPRDLWDEPWTAMLRSALEALADA